MPQDKMYSKFGFKSNLILAWPGNLVILIQLKTVVCYFQNPTAAVLKERNKNNWENNEGYLKEVVVTCLRSTPKRVDAAVEAKHSLTKYYVLI